MFCLLFQGCASVGLQFTLPMVAGQLAAMQEEEDPAVAEQAIPGQLKMLEGFLKTDETNPIILQALAEGFCGYAYGFVEDADPKRAAAMYLRGMRYAVATFDGKSDIGEMLGRSLEEFDASVRRLGREAVAPLYWLNQCWSGWLMQSLDDIDALADIPKVEVALKRVVEIDPNFHFAGPHRLLGGFYGGRGRLLGGDPEKSRQHFEQSLQAAGGGFLLNRVLYAKTYAVQMQDRKLFEQLLGEVLWTPSDVLPTQRLANEIAKIKAQKLLESADDLF